VLAEDSELELRPGAERMASGVAALGKLQNMLNDDEAGYGWVAHGFFGLAAIAGP
jgi:hypothetical protein